MSGLRSRGLIFLSDHSILRLWICCLDGWGPISLELLMMSCIRDSKGILWCRCGFIQN